MKTVARYSPITFPVTKDGGHACLAYEDKDGDNDENPMSQNRLLSEYESHLFRILITYTPRIPACAHLKSRKEKRRVKFLSDYKKCLTIKTYVF